VCADGMVCAPRRPDGGFQEIILCEPHARSACTRPHNQSTKVFFLSSLCKFSRTHSSSRETRCFPKMICGPHLTNPDPDCFSCSILHKIISKCLQAHTSYFSLPKALSASGCCGSRWSRAAQSERIIIKYETGMRRNLNKIIDYYTLQARKALNKKI
jgi:hypothetical protein